MNNLKFARSLLVFSLALMFTLPSIAGVRSITNGIDLVENELTVGKKVMVACTNGFIKRALVKRDTEDKWCDTVLGNVCATNQKVAARLVCADDYRNQIAAQKNGESVSQSDESDIESAEVIKLKQELMEIELKRLDIADKVLELKRKELQLQKEAQAS